MVLVTKNLSLAVRVFQEEICNVYQLCILNGLFRFNVVLILLMIIEQGMGKALHKFALLHESIP